MTKDYWKRKPVGETIMAKVAREYALQKAGIDPLTPAERAEKEQKMRADARNYDKHHKDWDNE